jgi:adenylate cyclase class 2
MLEVEVKIKVKELSSIRKRLIEKGAKQTSTVHEHDRYYNAPHRDFGVTDEALRVRYSDDACAVTYKGPKLPGSGSKVREEVTVDVMSGEAVETILAKLGFTRTAEVDKEREYFEFGPLLVSLDRVSGLGSYVEVEMMTAVSFEEAAQKVENGIKELDIEGERIMLSYLEQVLSRR